MATSENTGTVVQAWVSPKFAREIKDLADRDGRTVSNLIRVALRDRLSSTSPSGEGPASRRVSIDARRGAGTEESGS